VRAGFEPARCFFPFGLSAHSLGRAGLEKASTHSPKRRLSLLKPRLQNAPPKAAEPVEAPTAQTLPPKEAEPVEAPAAQTLPHKVAEPVEAPAA